MRIKMTLLAIAYVAVSAVLLAIAYQPHGPVALQKTDRMAGSSFLVERFRRLTGLSTDGEITARQCRSLSGGPPSRIRFCTDCTPSTALATAVARSISPTVPTVPVSTI